jgi:uncharacterized protein YbaP (TraB family)
MINDRNKNWVEKFPDITKDKSILIAVGAGISAEKMDC